MRISYALLTLAAIVWPAKAGDSIAFTPTAEDVVRRLVEMDTLRASTLRSYISARRYIAENAKFAKHAEVGVEESFMPPDQKVLKVVSETGSPFIRRKVIDKLIEAEIDAISQDSRDQTHITPENYNFRLIGTEEMDGASCFVLEVMPKFPKKYLMRGRVWIDQNDFAIVRMEGSPAKNPSFWTRKVRFVRHYQKHGPFWLPASVESESEIVIAGKSTLKIEYWDYRIEPRRGLPVAPAGR